jgi:serine/threonine-protein kinase
VIHEEPPAPRAIDPRIPRPLETVVLKALEKDPARRYATALEFAEDLRRFRLGEDIRARRPSLVGRGLRRARKDWKAIAVVLLLAAAAAGSVAGRRSEARERGEALGEIRERARIALDAALRLRRAGDLKGQRSLLGPLQAAYEKAASRAGDVAELDYLLGRMHRALLDNARALADQNRALAKDPGYAPALYERIILLSHQWGDFVPIRGPGGGLEHAYALRDDLRQAILDDSQALVRALGSGASGADYIGPAHLAASRGILAMHRGDFDDAVRCFRDAIGKDPCIEEAWQNLSQVQLNQKGPERALEGNVEASETLEKATSFDLGYLPYWEELSTLKAWEGVLRSRAGEIPDPYFAAAQQLAERLLALDPESPRGFVSRSIVRFHRAVYRSAHGRDPHPDFDGAESDLDRAGDLGADRNDVARWRMRVRGSRVIHRVSLGEDPGVEFRKAAEALSALPGEG